MESEDNTEKANPQIILDM